MTSPMSAANMGNPRYFDVYLDDPSSSEDETNYIDLSRPLMSPRKYHRLPMKNAPVKTNTPDTKLPKRTPVWYYKRKKDCLQAFYIIMIIMVIIIFALVLVRILNDAAKHSDEDDDDKSKISTIAGLGNFAMTGPFGVNIRVKTTTDPPWPGPSSKKGPTPAPSPPKALSAQNSKPKPLSQPAPKPSHPRPAGSGAVPVATPKQQENHPEDIPQGSQSTVLPCRKFKVQDVWVQNIPQLMIESGIRLLDANQDGVLDAVIGFATDANAYFADEYLMCSIYFNGTTPCFGGVLALDGITGAELWRHYSHSEVFAVTCNSDLTGDGVNDCAIAGRQGVMEVVNGATGEGVWGYSPSGSSTTLSNFYTAQFTHDIDGDGVRDLLNIEGGDPVRKPGASVRYTGRLMLLSGADGHVITETEVPDGMESYYSPQIYHQRGGEAMVLFGTGGETIGGSLWVAPLDDLINGHLDNARAIYTDPFKGVMTPPVLVDLTGDGVMDIVMSMFNSTVIAFDGQNYHQLWNHSVPFSESYSTPAAGFYNDDDVPDFMIVFNYGPGYPIYYYAQVTVLDGRNGQPLLEKSILSSGAVTTSPITVSSEGFGHDAFLYWKLDCKGHEGETTSFQFADQDSADNGAGTLSRTDFCRARFNAETFSQANLLNRFMESPGQEIYNSDNRFADEHSYRVNATKLAAAYLKRYPELVGMVLAHQNEDPDHDNEDGDDQDIKDDDDDDDIEVGSQSMDLAEEKTPATTTAVPATTTLDFQAEYDRLMAKLAALSQTFEGSDPVSDPDSGTSPPSSGGLPESDGADSDGEIQGPDTDGHLPDEKLVGGMTEDEADEQPKGEAEDLPKTSPSTSEPDDDDILSGDIAENLRKLGFPESWLDPSEAGETDVGTAEDTAPKNIQEQLGDISDGELQELLLSLLEEDETKSEKRDYPHDSGRARRHAGLHDSGGIQRVISTGTLAPSLSPVLDDRFADSNSIDVIFATYWFYPKPKKLIGREEKKCLSDWMDDEEQRMDPSNEYYGMDHDVYEHLGSEYCGKKAKEAATSDPPLKETNPLNIYPFNLDAGEMTVYRIRLSCDCSTDQSHGTPSSAQAKDNGSGAQCARILPFHQQQWGGYMGTYGNSYFRRRP